MRRNDARQLRERHQNADIERREPDALQLQAEEGRERPEIREIEKVEAGEAPVGDQASSGSGSSTAAAARSLAMTSAGACAPIFGVVVCTSAFCARCRSA